MHTPEIPVAAHAPDDWRFTSQEYADASAHGRANLQANVLQGKAGQVEHYAPTATDWEHPSAALRFAVTTNSGKRVWVYADRVEFNLSGGTSSGTIRMCRRRFAILKRGFGAQGLAKPWARDPIENGFTRREELW